MHSLRVKLMLFAMLLVLIPGLVIAFISVAAARRALENSVGRQLAEVAHDTAAEVAELLTREQGNLRMWARQDLMRETMIGDVDKHISRFLSLVRQNEAPYANLLCIDATGHAVAASDPALIGTVHSGRDWASAALGGREFLTGPVADGEGHTVFQIAAPIFHPEHQGEVIGGLLGIYDWAQADAVTARIQHMSQQLKFLIDVVVLDGSGRVIAEAPPMQGSPLIGRDLRAAGWAVARQRHGGRPGFEEEPEAKALIGFAKLQTPRPEWTALVIQPVREAFAPADQLQRRLLLLLAGVLLTALGVALLLAERMSWPLQELTEATQEIARVGETRRTVAVRSRDEIGHLATAFNTMVSELKRAEDNLVAAAKFAFVGEVAAGVAHEVRTPLGILRGSAQILARALRADQAEAAELVQMIIEEVDRIDRVVAGLLEVARPHEPVIEPTALAQVLARALDFVEGQARQQGVAVHRLLTAHQRPARCDPEQIYQVALNLIVNALQILERGGEITVETLAGHDGSVAFEVRDNGPGISEDVRKRLFTPFFTMRPGGTGLGLAVVQRIVQAHHGTVWVESAIGQGTTFRVELPAAEEVS